MDPFSSDESEDPILADASDPELMSEADSDFDPNEGGSRRRPRSTESSERSDSSEESDDSDNSDQIDYADDSDGAEVDDMEIARRLDREMNGLRGRPRRASVLNVSHPEPSRPKRRKTGGGRAIKLKVKLSTKRGARRIVESSSEEEEDNEYYIPRHSRQTRANNFTSGRKKADIKATLAKVKNLQNGSKDVKPEVKVQKMKLYLSRVGKFIQGVAKDKGLGKKEEERLWQYAAKKSHLQQDGTKMKAIYQRLSQAEGEEKKA